MPVTLKQADRVFKEIMHVSSYEWDHTRQHVLGEFVDEPAETEIPADIPPMPFGEAAS
ncbi:MAG TPA: hypothetical protein VM387_07545 [Gemmatimonadales bacterium]|jgi:hypothetical protein|nr:hypothetical protein [Gemmatimonadales bacterium]